MEANQKSSLMSAAIAATLLVLLYLPRPLLPLLFSPASVSAFLLVSTLFHLSSPSPLPPSKLVSKPEDEPDTRKDFSWVPIRGPLEVIYEEYEFDDHGVDVEHSRLEHACTGMASEDSIGFAGFALADTDTDSSSDDASTSASEDEELIEILLEEEDEDLIEIDIRS